MNKIKVSLDREEFWGKPQATEIPKISNRIGGAVKELSPTSKDLRQFAEEVAIYGHSFCAATFKDGKRSKENFEQQQFFALDFDNKDKSKTVSIEDVKDRAKQYGLPVLFSYDTFSSIDHDKFRVVFLSDTSISHRKVSEAMQLALGTIFPEADSSCYKDVSKMYFGGKELTYYDEKIPQINVESVFRGLTYFMKDKYKPNHYKEKLSKFSRETGVALDQNGLLDVIIVDDPTEDTGASQTNQNGKISPNSIIYSPNIIANGENFPNKFYRIRMTDCTSKCSVVTSVNRTDVTNKKNNNHNSYRKGDVDKIGQVCRLFRDFESGSRDLVHDEVFGILTNLQNADSGITRFKEILSKYPNLYDRDRIREWERHISYNESKKYKPFGCNGFCPYREECEHGINILSTVRLKREMMERLPGYQEDYYSIEDLQNETYEAIRSAFFAEDTKIHVIKAQTGAGKSYSYSKIMKENPYLWLIIATPSNLLKNEIYKKLLQMGMKVCVTPSLEEIKDEIPHKVWKHIQRHYKNGQHYLVHSYIANLLKKKRIPCLEKYMKEREKLKNFHGSIITTHRYLLNMDEKRLREFDAIIIDEDIIFKTLLPNQGSISVRKLKKLSKEVTNYQLSEKIERLIKQTEDKFLIELDSFKYDAEEDDDNGFDFPSFCQAEKFLIRRSSKEQNLEEDTIDFLKPAGLKKDVKYIMVSATASEYVCRRWFGEDRVDFYECKKAKYQGTLYQYPNKTMSRSSMANDPDIVQRLMRRFGFNESRVITFKKENIGVMHFGNAEGSNELEGKDILVVGTPYHADFIYKLAAFTLGIDFDENEEVSYQTVTHNGYRFQLKTFKNEGLRAIQFWMLESELEQAVGRARLLRNSCKVYLFSRFPLSQAEMICDFDYSKE